MTVYIQSTAQISAQEPLTSGWLDSPRPLAPGMNRSIDAQYGEFISPMAARRMGALLKRAVATSLAALRKAEITDPDAIAFGTGMGCLENSEKFLISIVENGENCLQPTAFINSTHNTIASQVANILHCHGYNNTYAHLGISFESALLDVLMQFELGRINSALVGGYDELTDLFYGFFRKAGQWPENIAVSECAAAITLSTEKKETTLCSLKDVELFFGNQAEASDRLSALLSKHGTDPSKVDMVLDGRTGDERYDGGYDSVVEKVFGQGIERKSFKAIFGESFTSGAFGVLAAAELIARGKADTIVVINSYRSTDWAFTILER